MMMMDVCSLASDPPVASDATTTTTSDAVHSVALPSRHRQRWRRSTFSMCVHLSVCLQRVTAEALGEARPGCGYG